MVHLKYKFILDDVERVDLRLSNTGAPNQLPFSTLDVVSTSLGAMGKRRHSNAELVLAEGSVMVDKQPSAVSHLGHSIAFNVQKLDRGESMISFTQSTLSPALGAFGIHLLSGWQKLLKQDALEGFCEAPLIADAAAASIPSRSEPTSGEPRYSLQAFLHCFYITCTKHIWQYERLLTILSRRVLLLIEAVGAPVGGAVLTGKGGGAGAKANNHKVRSCYSRSVMHCKRCITR
jgi:hypothetical protein